MRRTKPLVVGADSGREAEEDEAADIQESA